MFSTHSWRGLPLAIGKQTDVLLQLEDYLEQDAMVFVRILDAIGLQNRLVNGSNTQYEDAVLLTCPFAALLATRATQRLHKAIDRDLLLSVLLNVSEDHAANIMIVGKLGDSNLEGKIKHHHQGHRSVQLPTTDSREQKANKLVDAMKRLPARIVLSTLNDDEAFNVFWLTHLGHGKPIIWIQCQPFESFNDDQSRQRSLLNLLNRGLNYARAQCALLLSQMNHEWFPQLKK